MKYFLITILIVVTAWTLFAFAKDNTNNDLVLKYDEIIFDFEEILNSVEVNDVQEEKMESAVEEKEETLKEVLIEEPKPEIVTPPKQVLLDVDFTSQAPFRDWSYPWQEACEEAAVLITMRYFDGRGIEDKYDARDALQEIIDWEVENLGFYKDTTATTTMQIITDFYEYPHVEISFDVYLERMKKEIAKGNLIILPAAGRLLENPYFTPPGPIYHNIVLIGYDDEEGVFYSNDPGIMSGGKFKYSYENIIESVADWSYEEETINMDRRVMIIVGPN